LLFYSLRPSAYNFSLGYTPRYMCAFKIANPLTHAPEEGPPLDTLEGVIERITFHNEENGYTVARLLPPDTLR